MTDTNSLCSHLDAVARRDHGVTPDAQGCRECLATGGMWVHLRLCLTCGHVGCCDQSPNRHATRHFRATNHPVIRSFEPHEPWGYCFLDDTFAEQLHVFDGETTTRHFEPRPTP